MVALSGLCSSHPTKKFIMTRSLRRARKGTSKNVEVQEDQGVCTARTGVVQYSTCIEPWIYRLGFYSGALSASTHNKKQISTLIKYDNTIRKEELSENPYLFAIRRNTHENKDRRQKVIEIEVPRVFLSFTSKKKKKETKLRVV